MAIAFVISEIGTTTNGVSSVTFTLDAGSGSDRIMMFGAMSQNSNDFLQHTYNGVNATAINTVAFGGYTQYMGLQYLVNPASGSNFVVIKRTASSGFLGGGAAVYTGAKQTGQPDASHTTNYPTASTTDIDDTINVATTDSWIFAILCIDNGFYSSPNGLTEREADGVFGFKILDSNAAVASGNNTVGYNASAAAAAGIATAAFSPAGGSSTTIKSYNGTVTANVKTVLNGTAIANRKTWNGIA